MAQSWQGDLGFEPIRARTSKRSWLAPVNLTEEFVLGDKAVVGASDGSNGKTAKVTVTGKVPDGAKVDVDGYDVVAVAPDGRRKVIGKVEVGYTPTIGECRQIELETDPVRGGLPYEPDGRETRVLTLPAHYQIRALRRCEVAEITVDSLKLDGGGSRLVPIDSVCVAPEQVAPKRFTVVLPRHRAPLADYIELRHKRPLGATLERKDGNLDGNPDGNLVWSERQYGVPRVHGPFPQSGHVQPYACRWREAKWREVVKGIVAKAVAGKIGFERAMKAIDKAKRWLKPVGMLPEPEKAELDMALEWLKAAGKSPKEPAVESCAGTNWTNRQWHWYGNGTFNDLEIARMDIAGSVAHH